MSNETPETDAVERPGAAEPAREGEDGLEYAVMDVFAETALEGNALAIVPDARGLSGEQMQRVARETNLSETTFVLPRDAATERAEGVRVRIFTVEEELPFAGHPTLGTAGWLHLYSPRSAGATRIDLALDAGKIPVTFAPRTGRPGVFGTMRQNDPVFGEVVERMAMAEAIGLRPEDLDQDAPAQVISTGTAFCIVPLRSLEVAQRLVVDQRRARPLLDRLGVRWCYCLVAGASAGSDAEFHARMQFYGGEDPATGSAAGCAIAWLVRHGRVPSGRTVVIEQGVEVRRPSRLHVSATECDGRVTDVFVGGRTVRVASGRLFLPGYTRFQQAV